MPTQIDESFIAGCRALLITGTHLSARRPCGPRPPARWSTPQNQVLRVLDIDYRPVLWGLTKRGEGATASSRMPSRDHPAAGDAARTSTC
jgi:sugar/nucleoside kinase (ribokinase family)